MVLVWQSLSSNKSSLGMRNVNLWGSASHLCHRVPVTKEGQLTKCQETYGQAWFAVLLADRCKPCGLSHRDYGCGEYQGSTIQMCIVEAPEVLDGAAKNTRHTYPLRQGGWQQKKKKQFKISLKSRTLEVPCESESFLENPQIGKEPSCSGFFFFSPLSQNKHLKNI